ncbi:2-amino-4-hydroxy-6-hydroxymethyldihydropteridine diphosphokinase [Brevibacterium gallinarum]|uniref:Bifunctional folate synthesis protein n=1 Tax=Brevibacterium gallinarum TaxID=2762220 RepID=A0ABR8WUE5_9MICO|nr:2-amino-4-hydroxy-6-hydroxymethyldihydropteridine diphosphokinase [Brevibacterium gallinarum]MBD8020583.1 2-amino-4-hydroxy-6-hydroxymethyldihydropteridine diphosphokinase [Brevibacterium gallinarum]
MADRRRAGDAITLTGLTVYGYHGVFDFERREGQNFIVDVTLHTDTRAAAASDALIDTADYGTLAEDIAAIIAGEPLNLIETLAERIAEHCLTVAARATVTVHKPAAPVPVAFDDVSVTITRPASEAPAGWLPDTGPEAPGAGAETAGLQAVLGLGANLGQPLEALRAALSALDAHPDISVDAASTAFATKPVGGIDQPDFTNAVAIVTTELSPLQLLGVCQGIELAHGRTREIRWGPRTLDIDLIRCSRPGALDDAAAEITCETGQLVLPHPRAAERAFVLAPWAQLRPAATVTTASGTVPITTALTRADDGGGLRDTGEAIGP